MPAIDVASAHAALAVCEQHAGPGVALHAMAALHPSETRGATEEDFAAIAALCDDPRVVAVGESGLDYYWDRSFIARQHDALRRHAQLAVEKDLPLVLHLRDQQGSERCARDLMAILKEERAAHPDGARLRGVFHCFGGPDWLAAEALDLGFYLGIGGTLTYKNGGVAEAIADVPLEKIVLETDAPYLAPVPYRGQRNEPAYVRLVAEKLAALRGLDVREVEATTTRNAVRLFDLPLPLTDP